MAKTMTEHEFNDCLQKNKIVNFAAAKKLVDRELKAAQDDLKAASQSLSDDREKWATVQAYYAMFHTARALLYSKGYREKSHYCLIHGRARAIALMRSRKSRWYLLKNAKRS